MRRLRPFHSSQLRSSHRREHLARRRQVRESLHRIRESHKVSEKPSVGTFLAEARSRVQKAMRMDDVSKSRQLVSEVVKDVKEAIDDEEFMAALWSAIPHSFTMTLQESRQISKSGFVQKWVESQIWG